MRVRLWRLEWLAKRAAFRLAAWWLFTVRGYAENAYVGPRRLDRIALGLMNWRWRHCSLWRSVQASLASRPGLHS